MNSQSSETTTSKVTRMFNSAACFIAAYTIITYGSFVVMGLVGKLFGFDSTVYYYGIKWSLNGLRWTKWSVTLIYLSNPAFAFLYGLFSLYMYDKMRHIKTILNVFWVWSFIIGTSYFCAQSVIASLGMGEYNSPYYQNFSVVYEWWRIPAILVYLMNIPFAALLIYFSVNYARPILLFAYSYTKVNKLSRRRRYFLFTGGLPFIIGAIVVTATTFPMNIFVHGVYLLSIATALTLTFLSLPFIDIMKDEVLRYKNLQQLSFAFIVVDVVLNVLVYISWRGFNL